MARKMGKEIRLIILFFCVYDGVHDSKSAFITTDSVIYMYLDFSVYLTEGIVCVC